jgi:cobalt/nickel transport system permease protein
MGFKNNNFIERSIMGALSFLKESIFADQYAMGKGFMQSIDPRVKTVTILFFIILTLLCKNIFLLLGLYALCLLLTVLSKVNLGFFLKRTWVFIPLFSLFIALPALFSFFTPGEAVFSFKLFGLPLIITRQGAAGALLFVSRVITSVSFAVLLSITTRHFHLLKVLRIFGVPQVFVMILGMCYRYVYLFVGIIEDTYLAIKSRVGTGVYYKKGQQLVAWNIAFLWQRSCKLNEDVYMAMLSRGYRGEAEVLEDFRLKPRDLAWAGFVIIFSAGLIYLNYGLKK